MPRPTPHGRKAAKSSRPGQRGGKDFYPEPKKKNRWSPEKREALGRKPRNEWDRDDRREDSRFGGGRGDRRDDRFGGRDDARFDRRRDDAPRTSDSRGRTFESYRPQVDEGRPQGGFAGRAPRYDGDRDERRGPGRRDDRAGRGDRFERGNRGDRFGREDRGFRRDDDQERGFRRDDRGGERRGYGRRDDRFGGREGRFERRDDFPREDRGDRFDRGRKDFKPSRRVNDGPHRKWEPRAERKPWERTERDEARRDQRREERGRGGLPADERSWRDERRSDERGGNRPAWGRDAQREDRGFRRDDRFGGHGRGEHHSHDRFEREDRPDSENPDQMSWTATDLGEIDDSQVHADEGFAALGVPSILVAALDKQGITSPFPIQAATIPDAISGRDVLGRGQTGSGKTLGFGLPMLTRISQAPSTGGAPRGLVLVPTRELALQCADVLAPLAKTLKLDLTLVAGGMGYGPQLRAFERGVDVVVATPGRLIDLLEQGAVDLSQMLVTVLDEADHMADLGFMPAVTTLLDAVPADGQRLLFSATLDHAVDRIVKRYLHDPVTHEVDSDQASVTTMEHYLLQVAPHEKNLVTAQISNREGRSVVFARTQMGATRIAGQLREAGVMAGALHGGLTQGARTRILAAFKEGTVPVLVATDVAARGIHVDDVTLVLEVDPPQNSKDYLHRAGRTARAGTRGVVASIVLPHQRKSMARITGQAGVKVEPIKVVPGEERLKEITGARDLENAPIEDAEYEALIAPRKQAPRGGGRGRGGYRGQGGGYRGGRDRGGYRGQGGHRGGRDFGGRGSNDGWRRER